MPNQQSSENVDISSCEGGATWRRWGYLSRALRKTLFRSYVDVLLAFVPIGIAAGIFGWPAKVTFPLNFLAIIPLASTITFSIDELALGVGHRIGRLMKASSCNAVEFIIGIVAVSRGQILVAQSSLLGSIFSYALLILGCSFFVAGYDKKTITFDKTMTNTMSSLMMAVCISLIIPTIMSVTSPPETTKFRSNNDNLILSRAVAIGLLILGITYLYFQSTHSWVLHGGDEHSATHENDQSVVEADSRFVTRDLAAGCILACSMATIIICSGNLVSSVSGLAKDLDINRNYISLVLIPPVGYFAKSVKVISMARRCRMGFVMRAIFTDILQITIFIIPFLILLGWLIRQPFTLDFNVFTAMVFFLTILTMTFTVQNGKANYFDGIMLMGTYVLIASTFYLRPGELGNFILPGFYRIKFV